jgi:hypothetical protein
MKRCRLCGSGHGSGRGSMGLKRRSYGVRVRVTGRSNRLWKVSSWWRPIVSQYGNCGGIDCKGKKKRVLKIEDFERGRL